MTTHVLDTRSASGLLALQSLPRVGPATALKTALTASSRSDVLERFGESRLATAYEQAQRDLQRHVDDGVEVIGFFDEHYPDRLRHLPDPPPVLYVRGDATLLAHDDLIAVVGTREPTVFGTTAAEHLTGALADDGWGIVSGLAKGIDTIAHRVAVERSAPTVAVMGGGLDKTYPAENRKLASAIVEQGGALVSEQPYGVPPRPNHLVARDRLQSGLSLAVLVVQCSINSGTLHTARFAAQQGRRIFCPVPHNENGASEGLRVFLERPARELCGVLPAWSGHETLCSQLSERPLAEPIKRDDTAAFLRDVRLLKQWTEMCRNPDALFGPLDED
jgi:DNA processing protein